ncbi:MAG: DEAD/DEAH box helicase [Acidobacteria bacterium]|nr:DEAD/DEAH box helicase [Acidobacteriota bacterium]
MATAGVFAALLPELQRAVAEEGYTVPTPIQAKAIPHLLEGRDLIGCAQTGTGKTAAFTLPILQYLAMNKRPPVRGRARVLILAPTRELAAQIAVSAATYGRHLRFTHAVIFGGVSQFQQVQALNHGLDILVATPGRLLDLMQQGLASLDAVEIFVLDEADRMLDMGFFPDIKRVIAKLPAKRRSLFFSATMEPEVVALARTLVHDAVHVTIAHEAPAVERIMQKVMFVDRNNKDALLVAQLADSRWDRVLVFTQMKHMANKVAKKLAAAGISAAVIHGNKSQGARTEALASFKDGRVRVLVATDIAARGLDVDGISHVINGTRFPARHREADPHQRACRHPPCVPFRGRLPGHRRRRPSRSQGAARRQQRPARQRAWGRAAPQRRSPAPVPFQAEPEGLPLNEMTGSAVGKINGSKAWGQDSERLNSRKKTTAAGSGMKLNS